MLTHLFHKNINYLVASGLFSGNRSFHEFCEAALSWNGFRTKNSVFPRQSYGSIYDMRIRTSRPYIRPELYLPGPNIIIPLTHRKHKNTYRYLLPIQRSEARYRYVSTPFNILYNHTCTIDLYCRAVGRSSYIRLPVWYYHTTNACISKTRCSVPNGHWLLTAIVIMIYHNTVIVRGWWNRWAQNRVPFFSCKTTWWCYMYHILQCPLRGREQTKRSGAFVYNPFYGIPIIPFYQEEKYSSKYLFWLFLRGVVKSNSFDDNL